MLKGKLDTSTKDNGSTSCAMDPNNVTEHGRNETMLIQRKIVDYFNS